MHFAAINWNLNKTFSMFHTVGSLLLLAPYLQAQGHLYGQSSTKEASAEERAATVTTFEVADSSLFACEQMTSRHLSVHH